MPQRSPARKSWASRSTSSASKRSRSAPFRKAEGSDGDVGWFYIPCPTSIFSEHWGTGGDKAGQRPLAVQVEESASMYYGTLEEMQAKMAEFDRPMVLFNCKADNAMIVVAAAFCGRRPRRCND